MLQRYFEPGALFSYKDYRNFFISGLIFVVGSSAFPIALAISVLDNGGTATDLGLILASRVFAGTIFTLAGGVWSDRLPRKWVMISADAFRGLIALILVIISAADMPLWAIGLLVFLMGLGDAFGAPAGAAIVPSLLPDHLLPAGNVARGIVAKIGTIAGPGVGGISVALIGADYTFAVTAVAFFIGTSLLLGITEAPLQGVIENKPSFITELREGLKLVWEIKWLAASIFMASFQLMVIVAAETVLLPVITRREFDTNNVFAISAAAFSLGGMISAIAAVKFKTKSPGLVAIAMWSLFAFAPLVLAFPVSPTVVIVGYFIAGLSIGGWEAYWVTAVQREVPQEMQGRVFSIDMVGTSGLMPLGMALVGPVIALTGEQNFLLFAIGFHLIFCYLVLLVPGVKELRDPRKPQSDSTISEQN
uniref:MFS transporter n=1 Tax=Candidatus Planktophila sp. TaxID=2175601 RepID=UPI00404B3A65